MEAADIATADDISTLDRESNYSFDNRHYLAVKRENNKCCRLTCLYARQLGANQDVSMCTVE